MRKKQEIFNKKAMGMGNERERRIAEAAKAFNWFRKEAEKLRLTEREMVTAAKKARREIVTSYYPFLGRQQSRRGCDNP